MRSASERPNALHDVALAARQMVRIEGCGGPDELRTPTLPARAALAPAVLAGDQRAGLLVHEIGRAREELVHLGRIDRRLRLAARRE